MSIRINQFRQSPFDIGAASHHAMQTLRNTGSIGLNVLLLLYFFTKSDIKSILIPITVFAVAAAPISGLQNLPHVVFWTWLHLLQFCVANQSLDPTEDISNKPDRPIPSGRITLQHARVLRWILIPTCCIISVTYSVAVLRASVFLALLTIIYNEYHAHSHWFLRNLVNAAGFMSFELGSTLIAGRNVDTIDMIATIAILLSGSIFATTTHAQDFKDTEGDRKIGRRTIPIVIPAFARVTVIVPMVLWSVSLAKLWELEAAATAAFMSLALVVGGRFLLLTSVSADQVSFYLYNIWLTVAHILPAYWRQKRSTVL